MQRTINSLIGYAMQATDGEIGKTEEFYFDDESWTVRYLIIKTGNWFSGKEVLISPEALIRQSWEFRTFPTNLTKDQIRNSPDIDTQKPISRRQEVELYGHYPWKPYWGSGFYAGGMWGIIDPEPIIDETVIKQLDENDNKSGADDLHLRSTEQILGNHIHAIDGEIGHVKDFIINDQTWELLYFVVSTHNFIGGKNVLLPVKYIREIQWYTGKIFVDTTIDAIKNSPEFNDSEFAGFENEGSGNENIHLK